jgi:hypothetical protein
MGLWDRLHKDETLADTLGPGPTVGDAVTTARQHADRQEVWGRAARCPQCGGIGYLDRVDLVERIQYEHCVDCFHKWIVTEAETVKV